MEALAIRGRRADEGPGYEAGPVAVGEDDVVRDAGEDGLPLDHQVPVADRDPRRHCHLLLLLWGRSLKEERKQQQEIDEVKEMEREANRPPHTRPRRTLTRCGGEGSRGSALYTPPSPTELERQPQTL
ncbi:hypothetical protein B296_00020826 [Ensete ventricosum]|uniref:Uncharacterized protein n=1 Tax=Ensete ventricosum TaxID=4639 RepID=A0A427A757_ENSVE|nr:hypothetical protein B296_00020826 [Ensete ventricosum]